MNVRCKKAGCKEIHFWLVGFFIGSFICNVTQRCTSATV
jgi:hypothetical protein